MAIRFLGRDSEEETRFSFARLIYHICQGRSRVLFLQGTRKRTTTTSPGVVRNNWSIRRRTCQKWNQPLTGTDSSIFFTFITASEFEIVHYHGRFNIYFKGR